MSKKNTFKVYCTDSLYRLGLLADIMLVLVIVLQVFTNGESLVTCLWAFGPFILLITYFMIRTKRFKVEVQGEQIRVRKVVSKFNFNLSDILEVEYKITTNKQIHTESMQIMTKTGDTVTVENNMIGAENFFAYILEKVPEDKILKRSMYDA